jgi:hypothetical protein
MRGNEGPPAQSRPLVARGTGRYFTLRRKNPSVRVQASAAAALL